MSSSCSAAIYIPHAPRGGQPDRQGLRPRASRRHRHPEAAPDGDGEPDITGGLALRPPLGASAAARSVEVGGELTLEMLDLRYDDVAKFYEAPLQVKANGGMLLIDDFGRQKVHAARPAEPLDRAAGEAHRLPDPAHRQEVRGAVRPAAHLLDQPRPARAGGRGVPAPHPLQDRRRRPDRAAVLRDLLSWSARPRASRSIERAVDYLLETSTTSTTCRCAPATRATSSSTDRHGPLPSRPAADDAADLDHICRTYFILRD